MTKDKNKHNKGGQGVLVPNDASTDLYDSDRDDFGEEPIIPSVTPSAPELPTKANPQVFDQMP